MIGWGITVCSLIILCGGLYYALNFIKDEQNSLFIAQLPQAFQKLPVCRANTALTLYGFHQNGCSFIANGCAGRFQIFKCDLVEALRHRSETFKVFLLSASGECLQRQDCDSR